MYQLIIFGPPGVGKGTQAEVVASKLHLEHISTGAILRKAVSEGTDLGKRAQIIMDKGNLVPDEIMNGIVKESLKAVPDSGFILDGYPRTIEQAIALSKIFQELNFNNIKVIIIKADENEIIERLLKRGRTDDTRETIATRLNVYYKATAPVKDYYYNLGLVVSVNGVGKVEDINNTILNEIN